MKKIPKNKKKLYRATTVAKMVPQKVFSAGFEFERIHEVQAKSLFSLDAFFAEKRVRRRHIFRERFFTK